MKPLAWALGVLLFLTGCDRRIPSEAQEFSSVGPEQPRDVTAEPRESKDTVDQKAPDETAGLALSAGMAALQRGDADEAFGQFTIASSDASLSCHVNYGLMLVELLRVTAQADEIMPLGNHFLKAFARQDEEELTGALAAMSQSGSFNAGVGRTEKLVLHADAVLDEDCFRWEDAPAGSAATTMASEEPSQTSGLNQLWSWLVEWWGRDANTDSAPKENDAGIVKGKRCSTKSVSGSHLGQCGFYLDELPLALKNSPDYTLISTGATLSAVQWLASGNEPFVEARAGGEWDRGEAALLSALGHGLLAGAYLLRGIQTETTASTQLEKVRWLFGIKKLRGYGAVMANDPGYLGPDPNQADELDKVAGHAQISLLRFSQLAGEFEADVDDQNDDVLAFHDRNASGLVDGGDRFSLKLKNEALKFHGLGIGRLISLVVNWRAKGPSGLLDTVIEPRMIVAVPKRVERRAIAGLGKLAGRISQALKGVDDANVDDTLTSTEVAMILHDAGLNPTVPQGYVNVHVAKAFDLLKAQGVRGFLPVVAQVEGVPVLEIENEVAPEFAGTAYNKDMAAGDTVHFESDTVSADCAAPGVSEHAANQAYYYRFSDPSFNGALEINASLFDDACRQEGGMKPATNFVFNKWTTQYGVPVARYINLALQLAEIRPLTALKRSLAK